MSYSREGGSDTRERDVVWENVKTLYEYKNDRGNGYWLRIGKWVVDGKPLDLQVEKRAFKEGDSGFVTTGKAQGFNKQDLYRLFCMAPELSQTLGFPLPKSFQTLPTPDPKVA